MGLQSGPGFFDTIKHEGLKLNLIATALLVLFVIIFGFGYFFDMPKTIIDGIFTGALTSVPALAAALEIKHTATTSVIFGLVYPFGIVATVLFIRVLPVLFRVDLQEVRAYEAAQKTRFPDIHTRNFRITNFKNTEIKKSKIESMTSTVIERMTSDGQVDHTSEDLSLSYGDVIRVAGTDEQLANLSIVLGQEIGGEHGPSRQYGSFKASNHEQRDRR